MSTPIHTATYSFAKALWCKANNETLSPKTLRKLTIIANREFGGRAERVFGKGASGNVGFNGDAAGLRNAISSQLNSVRSASLRQVMSQWLGRLPVFDAHVGIRQQVDVSQRTVPSGDKLSAVAAWVSMSPAFGGVPPQDEMPAAGIPPVDYMESRVPPGGIPLPDYGSEEVPERDSLGRAPRMDIPEADYDDAAEVAIPLEDYDDVTVVTSLLPVDDDAQSLSGAEAPLPDHRREGRKVHFSDVVSVMGPVPAEVPIRDAAR